MTIWAIIPVKPPLQSKRRLAHLLSPEERADLIGGFLDGMLAELRQVEGLSKLLIVSRDPAVGAIARRHDVVLLEEKRPFGLNSAVTQAAAWAGAQGASGVLILPVDLPFLRATDIQEMLDALPPAPALLLAADSLSQGTNGLLVTPPNNFAFHYGPNSLHKHLQEAQEREMACRVLHCPGLQFDLDTEADWQIYRNYTASQDLTGFNEVLGNSTVWWKPVRPV
jgi:2-phospho-L-lactate/phosphoenolpyruvate guanylyltransferase